MPLIKEMKITEPRLLTERMARLVLDETKWNAFYLADVI